MSLRNCSGMFLVQLLALSVVVVQARSFSIRQSRQTDNQTQTVAITLLNKTNISKTPDIIDNKKVENNHSVKIQVNNGITNITDKEYYEEKETNVRLLQTGDLRKQANNETKPPSIQSKIKEQKNKTTMNNNYNNSSTSVSYHTGDTNTTSQSSKISNSTDSLTTKQKSLKNEKLESIKKAEKTTPKIISIAKTEPKKNHDAGNSTSNQAKPKTTLYRKKYTNIERTTPAEHTTEIIPTTTSLPPQTTSTIKTTTTVKAVLSTNLSKTVTTASDHIISTMQPTTITTEMTSRKFPKITEPSFLFSEILGSQYDDDEDDSDLLKVEPVKNEKHLKPEVVSSKRGGYLDNSVKQNNNTVERITTEATKTVENSTTEANKTIKNITNEVNKTFRSNKDKHLQDNDIKSMYDVSQSEMIEEALLAEKLMSDSEQLRKLRTDTYSSSSEEKLETKPTSNRNNSIYAVNPNYKPLKKLEVSTPKPYHKHPDDNSWRNQSISQNLGIVFNPKNSTKPLTQVLKNKTETELLMEKEPTTSETPDLRDRLAKLADSRRTKFNKVGSSNGNSTTIDDEDDLTWHKNIFETYDDVTVKTDLSSPLSKAQQKILHDYENDEYNEADDFSLANVEINKRSQGKSAKQNKNKVASISDVDYAIATGQFQPNRKPTVQYFPPRTPFDSKPKKPQPVNGNDEEYIDMNKPITTPEHATNYKDNHRSSKNSLAKNIVPSLVKLKDSEESFAKFQRIPDIPYEKYNKFEDQSDGFQKDMPSFLENLDRDVVDTDKDYPMVYKTSVVHETPDRNFKMLASSGASMRQMYEGIDINSTPPNDQGLTHIPQNKPFLTNSEQDRDYMIDIKQGNDYLTNMHQSKDFLASLGPSKEFISPNKDIVPTDYGVHYYIPQGGDDEDDVGGSLTYV